MFAAQEAQIVARLQAQLAGIAVLGTFGRIDFRDAGSPDLAVQVRYQGFAVQAQRNARARLSIAWEVAVVVRLAAIDATLATQADAALAAIIAALTGWEQSPGILAVQLTAGGEPQDDESGAWRFPIQFEGPAIVAGA